MPHPKLTRAASTSGANYRHPEGGFVLKITGAEDHESDGYVGIEYDIAEGDHAGHYEYACDFRRYYQSSYEGATPFEKFMSAVEESNPGFDLDKWQESWDCSKLEGLLVGAVFKKRMYTDDKGNDREQPRLTYCCSVDSIRAGRFRVPDPVDERVTVVEFGDLMPLGATLTDDDIPF